MKSFIILIASYVMLLHLVLCLQVCPSFELKDRVFFRCFSLKALAYCRVLINASAQCFCHLAL